MAVFQTLQARRKEATRSNYQSGVAVHQVVEYTFNASYVAAADRIELFAIPAGAQLIDVRVIFANIGAVNTTFGIMSGDFGSTDNARTVGTQLFSAQTMANAEVNVNTASCLAVAPDATRHRGVGMIPATDIAAGGTKKITLVITYVF